VTSYPIAYNFRDACQSVRSATYLAFFDSEVRKLRDRQNRLTAPRDRFIARVIETTLKDNASCVTRRQLLARTCNVSPDIMRTHELNKSTFARTTHRRLISVRGYLESRKHRPFRFRSASERTFSKRPHIPGLTFVSFRRIFRNPGLSLADCSGTSIKSVTYGTSPLSC